MRCASDTSRKSEPSPSKFQGRPASTTSRARLVVAVEQLVGDPAGRVLVGQFDGIRAIPLDVDDRDEPVGRSPRTLADCRSSSSAANPTPPKPVGNTRERYPLVGDHCIQHSQHTCPHHDTRIPYNGMVSGLSGRQTRRARGTTWKAGSDCSPAPGNGGPQQQVTRAAALMLRLGCPRCWCPTRDPTRPSRQSESGTDPARSPQHLTAVCVERHDQREDDNQTPIACP